ncbi:hypothetical protein E4U55_000267 [Claviceps digitariae]|nr:hypothetical protein E4U55_000267 [Claviceps digitariae]
MGNCQSCLGRRDYHDYEEGEETCLLDDDGQDIQYGSFDDQYPGRDETVESLREHDVLQRMIAKASNSMVDVFEIEPHHAFGHAGTFIPSPHAKQGTINTRYHNLASKFRGKDGSDPQKVKIDWLVHGHGAGAGDHGNHANYKKEMQSHRSASIKTLDRKKKSGPLVGNFADAAAAMT